ncbi:MAG: CoA transferase [Burkholderiaceae bacterium]|nr:CoA transferase [Burkholderiaceae bacterium]
MYPILQDLRVVECASFIAAPSCALHLQQLGAQVIRIDPIGGGPDFHRWPVTAAGHSLYWEGLNKGKRSIAVDFGSPEGRELVAQLICAPGEGGGIFVTNFPVDGFLSHERLAQRRSDLITTRVMGWSDGTPAVDYTVNAAVGIPLMTGDPERNPGPVNHVLPAWDLLAGAQAATATLAAERHRRATGQGQELRVPLSDIAIAALGHLGQIAEVDSAGDRPKMGNALFGAFGRDFATADGQRLMLVAITARQWSGLVAVLGLGAAVAAIEQRLGVSFARDEGLRFRHRGLLVPLVEAAIASRRADELGAAFDAQGVCWGPYRSLADAVANEPRLVSANPVFAPVSHPSGLSYPTPGAAVSWMQSDRGEPQRAPRLGEHTDQVLAERLGLTAAQIGRLHDAGRVAGAG